MSQNGRYLAFSNTTEGSTTVSWCLLPSKRIIATKQYYSDDVNDIALSEDGSEIAIASKTGLWLLSMSEPKPKRVSRTVFLRLASLRKRPRQNAAFLGLAKSSAFLIRAEASKPIVYPILSELNLAFFDQSETLVLPSGTVVLPIEGVKLDRSVERFVRLSHAWPTLGIYDVSTGANQNGTRIFFRAKIDAGNTTHFTWTATECLAENVSRPGSYRRVPFPRHVRVYSAFLTDQNVVWYDPRGETSLKGLRSLRIEKSN